MSLLLLSQETVERAIDSACDEMTCLDRKLLHDLKSIHGLDVTRITDWSSLSSLMSEQDFNTTDYMNSKTPWHFGIEIRNVHSESNGIVGVLTFYIAYSSWNGRIVYVDRLECQDLTLNLEIEKLFLRILADIAVTLDCARLTWRHTITPEWHLEGNHQPEMHDEVITLSMSQDAMIQFISDSPLKATSPIKGNFSKDLVCTAFSKCLDCINSQQHDDSTFHLRLATINDLETISNLVKGLAEYVNEPDAIHMTTADYCKDGFDLDDPLWYCLLIDKVNEDGSKDTCGYAFIFVGYRLGGGRFVYLEDLYLKVEHRGGGGGKLTMKTLAALSLSLECTNMYWQALDWNTSGLSFYKKIGAVIHEGEKTSRYAGQALKRFAQYGTN